MFTKALTLTAIILVFSPCQIQADVINSRWVGGEEGRWDDASNWVPPIVPDNSSWRSFIVTIDSNSIGADKVDVYFQKNWTIDQLDCYGVVEVLCWPLEAIGLIVEDDVKGLTNHGTLILNDGFILVGNVVNQGRLSIGSQAEVHGNIANYGFMEASGGVEIEGSVTNIAGAKAILGDEDEGTSIQGNLTNATGGLIEVESSLYIVEGDLDNAGRINLRAFVCKIDGDLINKGVLCTKVLVPARIELAVDVKNSGTIEVNAGGGVSFDCNLVNEPNAVIKLLGGTLAATTITQKAGANFAGFGGITGNVVIEPNAVIKLTGPTNIVGDVNIAPNATLEINDGTVLITGLTTCNGTIRIKGGRIIPQGGLSGNCNIISQPSAYTNMADFNLDGQVDFKDFSAFAETWLQRESWY